VQQLGQFLKKIRPDLTNQNDIKIQADSKLKYAYLMQVMDECTQAGFGNVGFAPPPDAGSMTP
jgi:biopolymer transport protein ExbD